MTTTDAFEQRAASAGAALRAAFLLDGDSSNATSAPTAAAWTVPVARATQPERRPRRALTAAAALVVGALSAGVLVLSPQESDAPDVLTPPAERETAVLSPPYLVGSGGTLPDHPVLSVQDFPVPFTFRRPPPDAEAREWRYYRTADLFDVGNRVSGITVVAPTGTYDPGRTWQGQTELVAAPTDGAGWGQWLEDTGHVDVVEREELRIGGAPATRFTLDLDELPGDYDGCGGGRTCLALTPMLDPQVGPARAGIGPQVGIDSETAELTIIELEDRAVLVLTTAEPGAADESLPTLHAVVESLRFA